jgi:hypothetical protein
MIKVRLVRTAPARGWALSRMADNGGTLRISLSGVGT